MNNAQYILRSLEFMDIDAFFMVPGKLINPIMSCYTKDDASSYKIQPIVAAHEAGATAMADGYARASGKVGVCMAIDGPGVTNCVSMMATAQADYSPVMLISGHIPRDFHGRGAIQDTSQGGINTADMFKPICASYSIANSRTLPQYLESAIRDMTKPNPGSTFVTIAKDIFLESAEKSPKKFEHSKYKYIDSEALECFVEKHLKPAKKILFMIGGKAKAPGFGEKLADFSSKYAIPIATTISSKGLFNETHKEYLGLFGYSGHERCIDLAISDEVDLIVLLDFDVTQWTILAWHDGFTKNKKIVQVDRDPGSIGKYIDVEYGIVGHAEEFIDALENLADSYLVDTKAERAEWLDDILKKPIQIKKENTEEGGPIVPSDIVTLARKYFPETTIAVADAGVHRSHATYYWTTTAPNQFFAATSFAPMGWAVPASIGISVACPDQPIVVFTGDGCMLMSGLEMQTAVKLNKNITFIVFNNGRYGASYFNNRNNIDSLTEIPQNDWSKIAEGLGVCGFRVETLEQLHQALQRSQEIKGPKLIDVLSCYQTPAPSRLYAETLRQLPHM